MNKSHARIAMAVGLALFTALGRTAELRAEPEPEKPANGSPAANDPFALSNDFWVDLNKTKSGEGFTALQAAVGIADKSKAAMALAKIEKTQRIFNLAIDEPAAAAKILSDSTAASNDAASANALATVVNMVTSPKTRQAAAPLVAPEAKARVESWTANLSTGIQGLPGIYLGDNAGLNGGARPASPAGYTPVAGGAMGCPSR
jgi:hypothetical protein